MALHDCFEAPSFSQMLEVARSGRGRVISPTPPLPTRLSFSDAVQQQQEAKLLQLQHEQRMREQIKQERARSSAPYQPLQHSTPKSHPPSDSTATAIGVLVLVRSTSATPQLTFQI